MKIESDASYIEVLQTLDAAVSLNFSEWFPAVLKLDSGERATLRNRLRASASAHAAELGKIDARAKLEIHRRHLKAVGVCCDEESLAPIVQRLMAAIANFNRANPAFERMPSERRKAYVLASLMDSKGGPTPTFADNFGVLSLIKDATPDSSAKAICISMLVLEIVALIISAVVNILEAGEEANAVAITLQIMETIVLFVVIILSYVDCVNN